MESNLVVIGKKSWKRRGPYSSRTGGEKAGLSSCGQMGNYLASLWFAQVSGQSSWLGQTGEEIWIKTKKGGRREIDPRIKTKKKKPH